MYLLFFLFLGSILSIVEISEDIVDDVIFVASESPYHITKDDLVVKEGVSLTVEAGVTLEICNYCTVIVKGSLNLLGSSNQKILITSSSSFSSWGSIRLLGLQNIVQYTKFEFGDWIVFEEEDTDSEPNEDTDIEKEPALVSFCEISLFYGINSHRDIIVENSTFRGCECYSIFFRRGLTLKHSTIRDSEFAIYHESWEDDARIHENNTLFIDDCFFADNEYAIHVESKSKTPFQILNSLFTNNLKGVILDYDLLTGESVIRNNVFSCNSKLTSRTYETETSNFISILSTSGSISISNNVFTKNLGQLFVESRKLTLDSNLFHLNTIWNRNDVSEHISNKKKGPIMSSFARFRGRNGNEIVIIINNNQFSRTRDVESAIFNAKSSLLDISFADSVIIHNNNFQNPDIHYDLKISSFVPNPTGATMDATMNYWNGDNTKERIFHHQKGEILYDNPLTRPTNTEYFDDLLSQHSSDCEVPLSSCSYHNPGYEGHEDICSAHGTCLVDYCVCEPGYHHEWNFQWHCKPNTNDPGWIYNPDPLPDHKYVTDEPNHGDGPPMNIVVEATLICAIICMICICCLFWILLCLGNRKGYLKRKKRGKCDDYDDGTFSDGLPPIEESPKCFSDDEAMNLSDESILTNFTTRQSARIEETSENSVSDISAIESGIEETSENSVSEISDIESEIED